MRGASGLLSRVKAAVPMSVKARLRTGGGLGPANAAVWDEQFAQGQWHFMGDLAEVPRYAVIAGYAATCPANRSVLDIGCGPGLLQPWLVRNGYDEYLGVDLSTTAIGAAQAKADSTTQFRSADAESFVPPHAFDIVIFNEMLYYMRDPVAVLRHYARHLAPGGSFLISLWVCRESWRVWRACSAAVSVASETRISNGASSWDVRVCQPLG